MGLPTFPSVRILISVESLMHQYDNATVRFTYKARLNSEITYE